jgi:triacylglycerol lipase
MSTDKNKELVVLVHGLGRTTFSMHKLKRSLSLEGYQVINWRYNSLEGSINSHIEALANYLNQFESGRETHAIGHSLGGLILRGAIDKLDKLTPRRLVFLGTPNHGAHMIARLPIVFRRNWIPQVIKDMHPESLFIKSLPLPSCQFGVIAGTQSFHPINPISWINKVLFSDSIHDGTVELESCKLNGMSDLITFPVNHSFLPTNQNVVNAAIEFIKTGKFR